MTNILTPLSLWKDFNSDLDVVPVMLGEKYEDGIKYEYVTFSARDTGMGRVSVYGILASDENAPSQASVLVMPDSVGTVDENVLKMFVKGGYTAFIVDYRGKWENTERFTVYPDNISYANLSECGRHKDFVDESADMTSWYEWVAVGIYARKFLCQRTGSEDIGLVGIRDGGEIAWKLACTSKFSCVVAVCACGWKAYRGYDKFGGKEPSFDDERHRFVAGIDSQSYAQYVKCPVMMLCSTNDPDFDYDRAYDTFSRINADVAGGSVITYSVDGKSCVDPDSVKDMFLFLDKCVKKRQVFLPKPAEISVLVDSEDNLIAHVSSDSSGVIEKCGVYYAEDCLCSAVRDWSVAPVKHASEASEADFYLNIYEKTSVLFVLCFVSYSNGFTVWSKLAIKKVSGTFRNSKTVNKVMYSVRYGKNGFSAYDYKKGLIGGIFMTDGSLLPQIICGEKELKGIYSVCGLITYRINNPQFAPTKDSLLKLDICPDEDMTLTVSVIEKSSREKFIAKINLFGGVWQSEVLEGNLFKTEAGAHLTDFTEGLAICLYGEGRYAVNNVMWL